MKGQYFWVLLVGLNSVTIESMGQSQSMPAEVTEAFTKMYPDAKNVDWRDKIDKYIAFFKLNDLKCEAKFTRTGGWISTEEPIKKESLPAAIKDGLISGKYADWMETAYFILRLPGGVIQYHIVVTRSDEGRKVLSFNPNGKLLTE
jgi:hypothetical protein